MSREDEMIETYEVREVVSSFHAVAQFEAAVAALESGGIRREAINMIASHDAVRQKLQRFFTATAPIRDDESLPQTIYEDNSDIASDRRMAVGLPVYIGGAGAGLAVVATGGTIAFAALLAAAGAAVGAGIGGLIAHAVGNHHAKHLQQQLELGALLILVEVSDTAQEAQVITLLTTAGGEGVKAHSLTRYRAFDQTDLRSFNPYEWPRS